MSVVKQKTKKKTKYSLWPITKNEANPVDQSKLEPNARASRERGKTGVSESRLVLVIYF